MSNKRKQLSGAEKPERLAVAGVLYETGIAEKGRFMRRLSSPTQSKSHGNTPSVSSTARAIASMGQAQRPTTPGMSNNLCQG
jgi:hypothetical protein